MLKDNKVTKANDLNLRAYKLSRIEQLFILSVISIIQPEDEDFKTYEIHIKDFINLLKLDGSTQYSSLPKLTKGLMSKIIEFRRPHSLLQVAWFSSVEHRFGEGTICVEFSPKLKPHLLNLKDNFVTYGLKQVVNLTSKYSIRLYELLKQYLFKKNIMLSVGELRLLIGTDDTIYPRYNNFKTRVLEPAQKELKEKTDIQFDFKEIKKGRKVDSIKFLIKPNKHTQAVIEPEQPDIIQSDNIDINIDSIYQHAKSVISDKVSQDLIKKLLNDYGEEKVNFYLQNWEKFSAQSMNNKIGFFVDCVRKGYNLPEQQTGIPVKPVQATNYEQREYDDEYYESLYDNNW